MGTGLSQQQKRIIALMSEDVVDVNNLAESLGYGHHVIRRSLRRLEDRGLVIRGPYHKQRGYTWQ